MDIQDVLKEHEMWLNLEDGGKRANLQGADLQGADLQGADLRHANLRRADLQGANLQGANLQGADLQGADLQGADLQGADLRHANLRHANLDFSCLPLWCGSLDVEVDKRLAAQIIYHFCRLECDDTDIKEAQNSLLRLANQFHRVGECGIIERKVIE